MKQNIKKEEIIKKMEVYFKEPDPLITIAAFMTYSDLNSFPADRKFLHNFVNKARKEEKFKKLLEDFAFSEVDIYPFSRFLEEILDSLMLCRFMYIVHIGPRRFEIPKDEREKVKKKVEKRFADNEEFIQCVKELGEKFRDYVKKSRMKII